MIRGALAWAWLIVVGGLLLTPEGWVCIRCGPGAAGYIGDPVILVLGVGSLILGGLGLAGSLRGRNAAGLPG
jgi:hypothetical protein